MLPFAGCDQVLILSGPPSTSESLARTSVVVRTVSSGVVKVSVIATGLSLVAVTVMVRL